MLSYAAARQLLASGNAKLENNTFLVDKNADTVAVQLYGTQVVLIHDDGTYTLNTGGYRTTTTKDRINKYGPNVVQIKKRKWLVNGESFEDGIKVDSTGAVLAPAF